jgi:hypothetical protein
MEEVAIQFSFYHFFNSCKLNSLILDIFFASGLRNLFEQVCGAVFLIFTSYANSDFLNQLKAL